MSRGRRTERSHRTGVALNFREVFVSGETEDADPMRRHKREFVFVLVGAECGNNDQENFGSRVARVVCWRTKGAKAIAQEAGEGRWGQANGEVDVVAGVLRYHNIC